ncbi:hypothetical protein COLO4_18746 [Corchorus olitorius]|uniref:Uncharacterized protein n=1 Tax=Corchorus olitorius TaxID=93759 RepID=A0A1R3J842_9ROSI|nr:hypothetical protein COLO4_18746 [Corchorus olitorius]
MDPNGSPNALGGLPDKRFKWKCSTIEVSKTRCLMLAEQHSLKRCEWLKRKKTHC